MILPVIQNIRNQAYSNIILCIFSLSFFLLCFALPYSHSQTYELTYKNLTSQTLTTSVCATHKAVSAIFELGDKASDGIKLLAEDGEANSLRDELRNNKIFKKIVLGKFVSKSTQDKLTIASKNVKRISCVLGMLTATNDAFVAINNIKLPEQIGQSKSFKAISYDAGTEVNSESCLHVPGSPCDAHFVGIAENSVIAKHTGIQGIADLSVSAHGWKEPSVRGSITRIK